MELKGIDKLLLLSARAKADSNTASIGDLTALDTTDKRTLVDALNETYNLAVGYSSDGLKEDVSTLQDEVEIIESAIRQINPTGAATATVTSFDTVNSLPVNAAQAGLGVVQEGMTAQQIVVNGDFSNGTTGWANHSNATLSVSNKVLSVTGGSIQSGIAIRQDTSYKIFLNDKIYRSLRVRVTNSNCTSIVVFFRDGSAGTVFGSKSIPTPTQNTWYSVDLTELITGIALSNNLSLFIQHNYADAATASGKVMEVDGNYGVKVVNLTAIAKQAATLSQADSMLLDYFSGTQSAVTGRVRSVGKNLFDGVLEQGEIDSSTGLNSSSTVVVRSKNYIKVKGGQTYTLSRNVTTSTLGTRLYDANLAYIGTGLGMVAGTATTSFVLAANVAFIRIRDLSNDLSAKFQLELGSVATTYESYRKTESYTKPMPLYRVPNGVADTVENGRYVKRVQRYVLVASDVTVLVTSYTNVDYVVIKKPANSIFYGSTSAYADSLLYNGIGNVNVSDYNLASMVGKTTVQPSTTTIWYGIPKGTYVDLTAAQAELAGTVIYYQLATPIITENVSSGTLLAYPSGTVYWEPVVADVAIYATGASILNTGYPISTLESIYKIDLVTGEQTPLAASSATVASGGLNFTHTGLVNGDMVGFTYYFAHALPYGENDYTYYNAVSNATYTKGVKTDLVEPNDFTVTTGAEKTLVLATPVYDDIIIQGLNLRVGTTPPTLAAFQDSIYAMKFIDGQTDIVYGSFELPHDYKEGTDLELHLHWSPSTTNTGTCVFNFAYTIAGINGTFGAEAVKTFTQAGSGTVNKHQYVSGNTVISGTGLKIGTIIVFALSRPTGDAFTGDAFLHSIGVHYQIDTIGSRTASAK